MKLAHRVGNNLKLKDIDPAERGPYEGKNDPQAAADIAKYLEKLTDLQERLFAEQKRGLLVVLQAMDTAGKDGVLRKVAGPLDSRGVQVASYKAPNAEERAHDYLWRIHNKCPKKGDMVFFNRSHYEDVLVVRVMGLAPKAVWKKRFDHINAFERMLTDEGTRIVKFFLHISKDEQKQRLQERLDVPDKRWKFEEADLQMREKWDEFMEAYEEALPATDSDDAPWYVIPANRKWFRDLAIAEVLVRTLEDMNPEYPQPGDFDPKRIVIPD